ncbi:DEAD/DEAH box helicase [Desulfogranum mediterraneum]|uniref:DEAD/DEAH box helicase n=1 Tax=Desulfogranum mediterraneum TaxID=160661 RepID=UPI00041968ED|nr:DEAD/DEAH box helicase [Desulfogranum mediterraneum]
MIPAAGGVGEYLASLRRSTTFGPQVIAHRSSEQRGGIFAAPEMQQELIAPQLLQLLESRGIGRLYAHQAEAIAHIRDGRNVIVATPTASGKSLIYNLPVFQELLKDPHSKALYLFPLKALAQDQLQTINELAAALPEETVASGRNLAASYDGDTSPYRRRKLREQLPAILITNPDMLHLSLLPYHQRWHHFFAKLRYIVIDEIHSYRGVFGSHVSWVLRRLLRLCRLHGSSPVLILASATVGNPTTLARELCGQPFVEVTESGAPQAGKHTTLINPLDSAAGAATQLLAAAVQRRLRTIIYTQSRKMTELITIWAGKRLPEARERIASYRAGFLPEDRREIESRLASGDLLAVISTSALELGIDIGSLDICILVGYPGSIMASRQRAGRVGRSNRESAVILLGQEDALDQYFMRNPDDFFSRPVESVTLNPANPCIAGQHLCCAAAEQPLRAGEPLLDSRQLAPAMAGAVECGELLQSADGNTWFAARKYPQRRLNIRGSGRPFTICSTHLSTPLGEVDGNRVFSECHPGAIYLHMARSYRVEALDTANAEVRVTPDSPNYFTRPLASKETTIVETFSSRRQGEVELSFGKLRVTETIIGYEKIRTGSMHSLGRFKLNLPPQTFVTEGFWITLPPEFMNLCVAQQLHYMGGIHAMEHAIIGLMPLFVLCDRNDLGGISYPWYEPLASSTIFVYDGQAGGTGLSREAFADISSLLNKTLRATASCPCQSGCPSCVHSPKCGSGNRPIDKAAALLLLRTLVESGSGRNRPDPMPPPQVRPLAAQVEAKDEIGIEFPENYCVFDLETRRSAAEVGGWHRAQRMGLSVAVLYDNRRQGYYSYREEEVEALIERLFSFELIIGFNNKRFDNRVLSAYTQRPLASLPSLDLLEQITLQLGYRLSLDRLAEKTLGKSKQANGLQALEWYRQGAWEQLTAYCREDVALTRDLFLFGYRQHYLLFQNKAEQVVRLPVHFQAAIRRLGKGKPSDGPAAMARPDWQRSSP